MKLQDLLNFRNWFRRSVPEEYVPSEREPSEREPSEREPSERLRYWHWLLSNQAGIPEYILRRMQAEEAVTRTPDSLRNWDWLFDQAERTKHPVYDWPAGPVSLQELNVLSNVADPHHSFMKQLPTEVQRAWFDRARHHLRDTRQIWWASSRDYPFIENMTIRVLLFDNGWEGVRRGVFQQEGEVSQFFSWEPDQSADAEPRKLSNRPEFWSYDPCFCGPHYDAVVPAPLESSSATILTTGDAPDFKQEYQGIPAWHNQLLTGQVAKSAESTHATLAAISERSGWSGRVKETCDAMCADDNAATRVEYLLAMLEDNQRICFEQRAHSIVPLFDNLIRIANDVKLMILKERAPADPAVCQRCGDKLRGHEDENGTHCRWCVTGYVTTEEGQDEAACS
jgi:hypothetical protein